MKQEICQKCVDVLTEEGYSASVLQYHPNHYTVYLESVWDEELQSTKAFRIHDEEIGFHASHWVDEENG